MLAPEDIPEHLGPATQAALSWINLQRASNYSLTGMIGADDLERADGPFEQMQRRSEPGIILYLGSRHQRDRRIDQRVRLEVTS